MKKPDGVFPSGVLICSGGRRSIQLSYADSCLTVAGGPIRVHCAALGVPIVGDRKYGGAAAVIDGLPSGGLMLHARAIELPHPAGGRLEIEAPLHDGMRSAWRFFGFEPATVMPAMNDSPE